MEDHGRRSSVGRRSTLQVATGNSQRGPAAAAMSQWGGCDQSLLPQAKRANNHDGEMHVGGYRGRHQRRTLYASPNMDGAAAFTWIHWHRPRRPAALVIFRSLNLNQSTKSIHHSNPATMDHLLVSHESRLDISIY